jgi:uncharacterized membrane protein YeiH
MFLVVIFEFIGTVAFAITGTLLGIKKQLDIFGVIFLAIITAVGGGIIRDIIIGNVPPTAFKEPIYCIVSIITSLITCIFYHKISQLNALILICDAIGLGIFTAAGANTALVHGFNQLFIVITTGLMTGVGGGILRDVFVKEIPFIFRKDVYAVASIAGALALYYSNIFLSDIASLYICFFVTLIIRIICIKKDIHLPNFKLEEKVLDLSA